MTRSLTTLILPYVAQSRFSRFEVLEINFRLASDNIHREGLNGILNCIHKNSFPEVNLNNRHAGIAAVDRFSAFWLRRCNSEHSAFKRSRNMIACCNVRMSVIQLYFHSKTSLLLQFRLKMHPLSTDGAILIFVFLLKFKQLQLRRWMP